MRAEEKHLLRSFIPGLFLAAIMWLVKGIEWKYNIDLGRYGMYPRTLEGLRGVFTMPLLHSDLKHIFSNTLPLVVLCAALHYFYRSFYYRVLISIWFLSGFWLWLGGRPGYHIGASAVVYGLASFLFFSGIFRRHTGLMALSLLVVFLYGGMVWGMFPLINGISWEGHLFGALAGFAMAYLLRKEGPQRKEYEWENEDDNDVEFPVDEEPPLTIVYTAPESENNNVK